MVGSRHIVLTVQYEPQPRYGRSLEWIAPELKGALMTMTEDRTGEPRPSRTWEGTVDARTFDQFACAWHLPEDRSEQAELEATAAQDLTPRRYTLDGMNWEESGTSPIVSVSVQVTRQQTPATTRDLKPQDR
jgi:hypothetical protein